MMKAKEDTTSFRRTTRPSGRSNVVPFPGQTTAEPATVAAAAVHDLQKSEALRAALLHIAPDLIFTVRKADR